MIKVPDKLPGKEPVRQGTFGMDAALSTHVTTANISVRRAHQRQKRSLVLCHPTAELWQHETNARK